MPTATQPTKSLSISSWGGLRRRQSPDCASDLTLDQLVLGELPEPEKSRVAAHSAACAGCRDALASRDAERAAFAATANLAGLAADALARAEAVRADAGAAAWIRRRLVPVGVSLGMCAGLAAVAVFGIRTPQHPELGASRTKGGFFLSTYVKHQEESAAGTLHLGEPLHPGDHLQFRYNGSEPGYLAIVAVDAAARVSIYYPGSATAMKVAAGREVPLATAVELDATLGRETIIAVRCERAVSVQEITASAERAVKRAAQSGSAPTAIGALDLPCALARQEITKIAQPRAP